MPRPHRNDDSRFRQESANLLLGSGRPSRQVGAEVGIAAAARLLLARLPLHQNMRAKG